MDSVLIEKKAVNAVSDSLVITNYLNPFISDNDKEPSWDGFVYIYNGENKNKNSLIGRVAVQVKGMATKKISKDTISYTVSVIDLNNYLSDRGVIFFVVQILEKTFDTKIYYASLAPIDLRHYLEKAKKQKTISITLSEFPSDNIAKSDIFLNFYHHSQKQISFAHEKLMPLDKLLESTELESITSPAYSFSVHENNVISKILNNPSTYLYAKLKNSIIEQPLEVLIHTIEITKKLDINISINKTNFYSYCKFTQTKDSNMFIFGDNFELTFKKDWKLCNFIYNGSNKLRVLVQDLSFLLSLLESGYFYLNDSRLELDKKSLNLKNFDVNSQKERLIYLKKIVNLFDLLDIKDDIDLSTLTDKDIHNIDTLIYSLIENKTVTKSGDYLSSITYFDIANFKILVFLEKREKNAYELFNFFTRKLDIFLGDDNGNKHPVSKYSVLNFQHFIAVPNINLHEIVTDFQRIGINIGNIRKANDIMLQLVKAYDHCLDNKRNNFLTTAKKLIAWINSIDKKNHYLSKEIKLLNHLQIVRRERDLKPNEIYSLYNITTKKSVPKDILVGVFLLIGDQNKARKYFQQLTDEEQKTFKDYPIYHFWK